MHLLAILAAAESDDGGSGAAGLVQLGILLLIPLAMYFLMIRPQRKRMREQQAMQASLEVGDEVLTASGIYGFITGFEDDRIWLEIDDDVQIRVNRNFVQGKVNTAEPQESAPQSSGKVTPTVKGTRRGTDSSGEDADGSDAERSSRG
jgi:preprotein translocase subunit YajC